MSIEVCVVACMWGVEGECVWSVVECCVEWSVEWSVESRIG